jgi:hypothetical protein
MHDAQQFLAAKKSMRTRGAASVYSRNVVMQVMHFMQFCLASHPAPWLCRISADYRIFNERTRAHPPLSMQQLYTVEVSVGMGGFFENPFSQVARLGLMVSG